MKSYNSFESFSTPNSKTRNLVISDPADLIGVNPIYTIYSPQGYPIIEFTKD
jgi:hypothetical protein